MLSLDPGLTGRILSKEKLQDIHKIPDIYILPAI